MKVPKRPTRPGFSAASFSSSSPTGEEAGGLSSRALPAGESDPLGCVPRALLNPSASGIGGAGSRDTWLPPDVAEGPEGLRALSQQELEQVDLRRLEPFRGDLRTPGVREKLGLFFVLARRVALSGRVPRRGSFLDLVL